MAVWYLTFEFHEKFTAETKNPNILMLLTQIVLSVNTTTLAILMGERKHAQSARFKTLFLALYLVSFSGC